ncbi:MAG: hypothetical protein SFU56_18830 [Capsulimonadales bacterium]|nr:hypothetical protein [Capsulimonadales bacterium]
MSAVRNRYHVLLTIEGYSESVEAGYVIEETMYAACRDVAHLVEKARDDSAFLYVESEDTAAIFTPSAVKLITVRLDPDFEAEKVPSNAEGEEIRSISEYIARQDQLLLRRL